MHPALETLMLAFTAEHELAIPARALFIGAEPHSDLKAWPDIVGWQPLKPLADAWDKAGFARTDELPDGKWPLVLILPGKSRDETLFWFALAKDHLESGGRIIAAMPNTAGAGRFEKELSKATGNITSIQKHKCRSFHALEDGNWDSELFKQWTLLGKPKQMPDTGYLTQAGIFSSDHVDPGSLLLAKHLPSHIHGSVADLGAGWGYLTDALMERCRKIRRVDLFEADFRALQCARQNLASRQTSASPLASPPAIADNVALLHFHWHDVTTGLPDTYDAIIMNPPFHSGQATDVDLGRAFLRTAFSSLKRGGKLFLVANRQLPYEAVLETSGLAWRKPAEDNTYKLFFAEKR